MAIYKKLKKRKEQLQDLRIRRLEAPAAHKVAENLRVYVQDKVFSSFDTDI
jgi:hypothetical protein